MLVFVWQISHPAGNRPESLSLRKSRTRRVPFVKALARNKWTPEPLTPGAAYPPSQAGTVQWDAGSPMPPSRQRHRRRRAQNSHLPLFNRLNTKLTQQWIILGFPPDSSLFCESLLLPQRMPWQWSPARKSVSVCFRYPHLSASRLILSPFTALKLSRHTQVTTWKVRS